MPEPSCFTIHLSKRLREESIPGTLPVDHGEAETLLQKSQWTVWYFCRRLPMTSMAPVLGAQLTDLTAWRNQ